MYRFCDSETLRLLGLKQITSGSWKRFIYKAVIVIMFLRYHFLILMKKIGKIICPYHSINMKLNWILINNTILTGSTWISLWMLVFTLPPFPIQKCSQWKLQKEIPGSVETCQLLVPSKQALRNSRDGLVIKDIFAAGGLDPGSVLSTRMEWLITTSNFSFRDSNDSLHTYMWVGHIHTPMLLHGLIK